MFLSASRSKHSTAALGVGPHPYRSTRTSYTDA